MRKSITYSAVLFSGLVLLLSCSKSSKDNFSRSASAVPDRIINAKVAPGQTYTVSVANAGNISIGKQAAHYLVSETSINETGSIVYKYSPSPGFTGADEVLLMHRTEIPGSSNYNGCNYGPGVSSHTSLIAVKITVAD